MSGASKKGKTYPQNWMSGMDERDHRLYYDCLRAKAQAKFRGQEWQILPLEYIALWRIDNRYERKGRSGECLTMTRIDKTLPWHCDNVQFITRAEHMRGIYKGIPRKHYVMERKC